MAINATDEEDQKDPYGDVMVLMAVTTTMRMSEEQYI